ncbi:MAG: leucine-rich repeat domain-containing protein, partial [Clostridia bacterium]|nr:leucine-rich repeat domain-containing protein [Clostridia bacterium]
PALGEELKATDEKRSVGYIFGTEESDSASKMTLTYGEASGQTATFYIPVALIKINIVAEEEINIPMYAFCGLKRIETITLSGNIKAIGRKAFKDMDKLSEINIPPAVETIYDGAFEGTASLKVFGDNGFKIDAGSNLAEIREGAFRETKLTNFDISDTQVKTIGYECFYGSALKTFTFSAAIEFIQAYAFANSKNLEVAVPACTVGVNAFADIKATL